MRIRMTRRLTMLVLCSVLVVCLTPTVSASHESTNALIFAPIGGSPAPGAAGEGTIDYNGGAEPKSRWTVSFTFSGLTPDADYAVVDQGRFGEDGSAQAIAFTPLCEFRTDAAGAGGCWNYLFGLRRVNIVQLRGPGDEGPLVLQATREPDGPGTITSVPNRFSPTPVASPASLPSASPIGG